MKSRRRLFLVALVLASQLPGCAAFDSPFQPTPAGMATAGASRAFVACALEQERALSSPAMTARICAAGADTPACR